MRSIILIFIATFTSHYAIANEQKADRLYAHWEYYRAAKLYKQEASKHPSADLYFKLGECYRKMNLYKEEQDAFDKVNNYGTYCLPEFYLYYGQVLRTNGHNDLSSIAFDTYTKLVPSDRRGKFFNESIAIVAEDHKWDEVIHLVNLSSVNTVNAELCPVLYKDGIVFTSNRKAPGHNKIYGWTGSNYLDLYFARKDDGDTNFSKIMPFELENMINKYSNGPACFSKNFDTVYCSRVSREMKGAQKASLKIERNKIFMAVMKDKKWSTAFPFYLNNDTFSVANPLLTADGSRLYFVSDMPGGYGETDIYYCNRGKEGWSRPVNMGPNVNTYNREKYPSLDKKGNFYFSSDGYQGFGGLDICVALNNDGVLEKAIPMKYPFNSPADDCAVTFLEDGKTGYLTSNRFRDGVGDDDIYYFSMLKDQIDTGLVTSRYTIGYRPKIHESNVRLDSVSKVKVFVPGDIVILFDFDRAQIRPDAYVHLDSIVYYMKEYPSFTLHITGRCDCRGTSDYNIDLAERRGEAALRYLSDKGISLDRMSSEGYGSNNLQNRCEAGVTYTDPEHQQNRRAYIHFQNRINIKGVTIK
jgi:outer membrane protein OmpA-like peptidoglycan-associated protein/tetratricopeptide (TPR) repeat protein